ncbi:protein ImuA [Methylopila capsulata]|uniref:Protein ImuA n=1 Tax=Methylopila capsulata TaxID=61654 RepID=A0ABS2T5T5_9HYPH|nr:DNA repair protein [Methylopila capsulata]MBM7851220.1 protein ImuA [Methylopila capsulata]
MTTRAVAETLDALRTVVARIEADTSGALGAEERIVLGVPEMDAALGGGLRRGALHAVSGVSAAGAVAATGFAVALAVRAGRRGRTAVWIRQDMSGRETGEPWPMGLAELGFDPDRLVLVRAPDEAATLRAAEAALACPALAVTLIEPFGRLAAFDRVAVRRLALAAGRSGVPAIVVRAGAPSLAAPVGFSAAETRWRVAPAASPPGEVDWGRPRFHVELVRNRRGGLGRWTLGWNGHERGFAVAAGNAGSFGAGAEDHGGRLAEPPRRAGAAAGAGGGLRRAG